MFSPFLLRIAPWDSYHVSDAKLQKLVSVCKHENLYHFLFIGSDDRSDIIKILAEEDMETLLTYLNPKLDVKLVHLVQDSILLSFTMIQHIYEVRGVRNTIKLCAEYKIFTVFENSGLSRYVSVSSSDKVCDVMSRIGRYSRVRFTRLNMSWYYDVSRRGLRHISSTSSTCDICVSNEEMDLVVSAFNKMTDDKFVPICESTALRMSYLREIQFVECDDTITHLYFSPDISELMPGEYAPSSIMVHNGVDVIDKINEVFEEELRLKASYLPLPFELASKIVEMAGRY